MNINKLKLLTATALVPFMLATPVQAGEFDGYTLRVKLIGGAQYEPLYAEIAKWEAETGATVDILSRKNHFELDREIKQDIAAGTLDWCVGSNHTSFAPQYGDIYRDLNGLIDPAVLDEFDALAKKSDTIRDPQEYAAAMQRMTKLLADSAWVIPIFAKLPPTLVRADLEGFKSNRMLMEMDARKLHWAD